jgi:hypothetical protein
LTGEVLAPKKETRNCGAHVARSRPAKCERKRRFVIKTFLFFSTLGWKIMCYIFYEE